MYLEFCNYNSSHYKNTESQTRDIFDAVSIGFHAVGIPQYLLKQVCTFLSATTVDVAVPIDFPTGTSDKKVREHEVLVCLKRGADFIDVPINPYLIKDRKYDSIEKEIKTFSRMCADYGSELRIMLQHNLYPMSESMAIARLAQDLGVNYILPASGFHNDDIYDNLLLCSNIEQKTNINTICNGHIWLEKQYNSVIRANIFGLRVYSLNLFSTFSV